MQYVPFASDIEIPFYASLARHKIDYAQLDDSPVPVTGLYEIRPNDPKEYSCRMQIHSDALVSGSRFSTTPTSAPTSTSTSSAAIAQQPDATTTTTRPPPNYCLAPGTIRNLNTVESYRALDRAHLLRESARQIWTAICSKSIYSNPSLLCSFTVISFADLKKYRFSYWFAFPALMLDPPFVPVAPIGAAVGVVYKSLTPLQAEALVEEVEAWKAGVAIEQHGFFVAKRTRRLGRTVASAGDHDGRPLRQPSIPFSQLGFRWMVASLAEYENGFFEGEYSDDCYVGFVDPSNYTAQSGMVAPGWPLRNLLALVRQLWHRDRIQVMCYRETPGRKGDARTVIYDMELSRTTSTSGETVKLSYDIDDMPKVTGWELNAAGKRAGRLADLTEYMDPAKLADNAVDLNLKLMKWRITPNLDLDRIRQTKCLLLGAGTLGSYVARNLLAWGVRKVTFVDNATVSFSNPVRQPLYNFVDCQNGGKRKAIRAAEALKEIYPGVDSEGYDMSVPMIGHPVVDATKTKAEFDRLEELIEQHDVVFLLMDSRESRWLPTVIGKAKGKIVMNAALGFDSYVVMRHGVKPQEADQVELGCYFCNDVVAPQNSMQDRTLDQQCTVTRPGLAAISSATLVEILVSVLQHPAGAAAPASSNDDDRGEHPLGLVPHTIRGFLSNFSTMNIVGRSYDCCSACSEKVVEAYRHDGWSFVEKALNDKNHVEELSGLKEVQRQAEAAAAEMEAAFEEGDGFGSDGEGELL